MASVPKIYTAITEEGSKLVVLWRSSKPMVHCRLKYRLAGAKNEWLEGIVTGIQNGDCFRLKPVPTMAAKPGMRM